MVACYKGFVDIVPLLRKCPYININQQDKDGNTALMMAAQAGGHRAPPRHGAPPTSPLGKSRSPLCFPSKTPNRAMGKAEGPGGVTLPV